VGTGAGGSTTRSIAKPAAMSALRYVDNVVCAEPTRIRTPSGLWALDVHQPSSKYVRSGCQLDRPASLPGKHGCTIEITNQPLRPNHPSHRRDGEVEPVDVHHCHLADGTVKHRAVPPRIEIGDVVPHPQAILVALARHGYQVGREINSSDVRAETSERPRGATMPAGHVQHPNAAQRRQNTMFGDEPVAVSRDPRAVPTRDVVIPGIHHAHLRSIAPAPYRSLASLGSNQWAPWW
jgi:hypothetical protein